MGRYLHRNAAHGYTASVAMAAAGEPEALDAAQLDELAQRAAETAQGERRTDLERIRSDHRRRAEWHAAQLRHHEREMLRLERRLAL
jgi:TolA-binding protein